MRLGAIQFDVAWHDPTANLGHLRSLLAGAAAEGVELAVLPEMFATGFSMDAERVARHGPSIVERLVEQATRHEMWIAGSVAMPGAAGRPPVNEFVAIAPDGETHRYVKRHPFSLSGEDRHYASGDELVTFGVGGVRVSPFICYDLRFGPDFWDRAVGTDLFLVVANWPTRRIEHWTTLLRARAIENQAYVAGVNRIGEGGGVEHGGSSMIIDPMGVVIREATDGEAILIADIEPSMVADARGALPFLGDR